MNKISLKNLNLKEVEQLSREQLKGVLGGFTGGTGGPDDETTTDSGCINKCSSKCPCKLESDWCDNGLCKTRPRL